MDIKDQNLAGSAFEHSNLAGTRFTDINLSGARFHDINFSDVQFTAAQIGGATFKHIGPPPQTHERQRGVTFEEATLCDSVFLKVDLSNVRIVDCNIEGMTVDGVLLTDLIAAYRKP